MKRAGQIWDWVRVVAGISGLLLLAALMWRVAATGRYDILLQLPLIKPLATLAYWMWQETAWLRANADNVVMAVVFGVTTLGWFVGGVMRTWSGQVFRGMAMMLLSPLIGAFTGIMAGVLISLGLSLASR